MNRLYNNIRKKFHTLTFGRKPKQQKLNEAIEHRFHFYDNDITRHKTEFICCIF